MKRLPLILFLFLARFVQCQDTTFYDVSKKQVYTMQEAEDYSVQTANKDDTNQVTIKNYKINGQLESETYYPDFFNKEKDRYFKYYHENGQLWESYEEKDGKFEGELLTFYPDGKARRKDVFLNGKLVEGVVYDEARNKVEYFDYRIFPEYPGGMESMIKFISRKVKYPKQALKNNIQGKVEVSFIVDKDGSITDVKISKGVFEDLDNEALRVVKSMPKWKPGKRDGRLVKVRYRIPIKFNIPN